MDRLTRNQLLIEFALPGAQRNRPGGFVKARRRVHHRIQHGRDDVAERTGRRLGSRIRGTETRDEAPSLSKRLAKRARVASQKPVVPHANKQRKNPGAKAEWTARRGNPQAREATRVKQRPQHTRPTLPKTPKFFSREGLMKGRV